GGRAGGEDPAGPGPPRRRRPGQRRLPALARRPRTGAVRPGRGLGLRRRPALAAAAGLRGIGAVDGDPRLRARPRAARLAAAADRRGQRRGAPPAPRAGAAGRCVLRASRSRAGGAPGDAGRLAAGAAARRRGGTVAGGTGAAAGGRGRAAAGAGDAPPRRWLRTPAPGGGTAAGAAGGTARGGGRRGAVCAFAGLVQPPVQAPGGPVVERVRTPAPPAPGQPAAAGQRRERGCDRGGTGLLLAVALRRAVWPALRHAPGRVPPQRGRAQVVVAGPVRRSVGAWPRPT